MLSIWQGDITRLKCDAIVNAANSGMLGCFRPGHTCIDNCIHTYAGVQLRLACAEQMDALRRRHGRAYMQPTAVPMLTKGYNLPAKKIVHIVGPIVETVHAGAGGGACRLLPQHARLCAEKGTQNRRVLLHLPGVSASPPDRAAEIAVKTVRLAAEHPGQMERVIFNVYKKHDRSLP